MMYDKLKDLLKQSKRITVVSHTNPDGDAIGSGIAWTMLLKKLGHDVRFIVPNSYPYFMDRITGIDLLYIYKVSAQQCDDFIASSEVIFCLDFNTITRLEKLGEQIEANTSAAKVLIDHHLMPPNIYDIAFSDTSSSSTSYLLYKVINECGWSDMIDLPIAEALYLGISTDTGNFTFSNLDPELFRAVANLVEIGVDTPKMNIKIYDNFSADRMRLMGYVLSQKMVIVPEKGAAYMSLTSEDLKKYNFRQGDSEGFVNIPLSISGINLSAIFIESAECIKVSLRSQGDIDVNVIARKNFNGGGHKNAAGGKSFGSMDEIIEKFKNIII